MFNMVNLLNEITVFGDISVRPLQQGASDRVFMLQRMVGLELQVLVRVCRFPEDGDFGGTITLDVDTQIQKRQDSKIQVIPLILC